MPESKKLWTRADARAEMNRLVKGATDACKAIHAAGEKIQALGSETGFEDDALAALAQLTAWAAPPRKLRRTHCPECGHHTNVCVCDSRPVGLGGDFVFREKTWGDRGCTCAVKNAPVSMPDNAVIHGTETGCPFRPGGPRENEFRVY